MTKTKFQFEKTDQNAKDYPNQVVFKIRNQEDKDIYDTIQRLDREHGFPGQQSITRTLMLYACEAYKEHEKSLDE